MPQMYKVFFNNNILFIAKKYPKGISIDIQHTFQNKELLNDFLFTSLSQKANKKVLIITKELKPTWKSFKSLFTVKRAAGGLVINQEEKALVIKRRGLWDLPKGHIEKLETKKTAAIREVSEECGLTELFIDKKLLVTYHTYYIKNKPILKPTHWYLMSHKNGEQPSPQTAEDITDTVWMDNKELDTINGNCYPAIVDVVSAARLSQALV